MGNDRKADWDDRKINSYDAVELSNLARELSTTTHRVKIAIALVGNSRREVDAYIRSKK